MKVQSWMMTQAKEPMTLSAREEKTGTGEVLVEVAGCGICHTDLGFFYDGVPTRYSLPLCLGHEVSGRVVEAGPGAEAWLQKDVIVPAVIPCGSCEACKSDRGSICPKQIFPGNDVHGGFATHVRVPALGLCSVPDLRKNNPEGLTLAELSVIADAVSTPYQAALRSGIGPGELAVFVGVGGVGGFGVQIARALGATVVAIDIAQDKLDLAAAHGASLTLRVDQMEFKELRKRVRGFASELKIPSWKQKIFETSGTTAGQKTAFGLIGHGGLLSVVGYTPKPVEISLSNFMALDASAQGNWGCLPKYYPAILNLVLEGKVRLRPFVETHPLSKINTLFEKIHARQLSRRAILVPEK